jgi:hypothetical protein
MGMEMYLTSSSSSSASAKLGRLAPGDEVQGQGHADAFHQSGHLLQRLEALHIDIVRPDLGVEHSPLRRPFKPSMARAFGSFS